MITNKNLKSIFMVVLLMLLVILLQTPLVNRQVKEAEASTSPIIESILGCELQGEYRAAGECTNAKPPENGISQPSIGMDHFTYLPIIAKPKGDLFNSAIISPLGKSPADMTIGDFNQDGHLDLAAVSQSPVDSVTVILGDGTGHFSAPTDYTLGTTPYSIASGHLNGDGHIDLAFTNVWENTVSILLGDGTGAFSTSSNISLPQGARQIVIVDFDQDNHDDIAVTNDDNTVTVLLGNGNGTFAAPAFFSAGRSPDFITTGDINNDGKLDIAVVDFFDENLALLLGNGAGSFTTLPLVPVGIAARTIAITDFNEDGKSDLAIVGGVPLFNSSRISILIGIGSGNFATPVVYPIPNEHPHNLTVDDYNSDGHIDVVASKQIVNTFILFTGDGQGNLAAPIDIATDVVPRIMLSDDFNSDSFPDLATRDANSLSISVFIGSP